MSTYLHAFHEALCDAETGPKWVGAWKRWESLVTIRMFLYSPSPRGSSAAFKLPFSSTFPENGEDWLKMCSEEQQYSEELCAVFKERVEQHCGDRDVFTDLLEKDDVAPQTLIAWKVYKDAVLPRANRYFERCNAVRDKLRAIELDSKK